MGTSGNSLSTYLPINLQPVRQTDSALQKDGAIIFVSLPKKGRNKKQKNKNNVGFNK